METLLLESQFLKTEMGKRMVSDILNEPDAYFVVQAVTDVLNKERDRRAKFYNDITEDDKIEFINGEIIVHSPVKLGHNFATTMLSRALSIFVGKFELGFVGVEKIMITLTRNDYEPDICFFIKEKSSHFTKNQTLFPAPDFVVEITSPSTEKRDRGVKFKDYQAHSIEEYWIIDPDQETLEQYHLKGEEYELVLKSAIGTVTSFAIPGFQIPIQAIFNDAENRKVIQNF
ncbi:Uma2 family endonuclease [Dyadobacter sp. CY323]|uniref:Uma2 family endonuclease n=1 Tax=Dyadobacter sp. CY323 TaxID=2907302 RepID=UPI001F4824CA|nr:Uma2 family endonuclease [Dyadobacter sp. CY323]MCE6988963.1 Uma2 family endonuclease [Dyadobacter sp. CY323]